MAEIGAGAAPPATRPRALRRRHGDSRVARLRATHSYGIVLGVVLCSLVFAALAPSGRFASAVLVVIESATLVVALWTSGVAPIRSKPIAALLGVAGVAALFAALGDGTAFIATLAIVNAALVGASIVVIARGAIDQGEVNKQSLRAAIAVYLLVGMFFVFVYGAAASLGDAAFFTQGTDGSTSLRFYFSFVTLATLGYGDYTPAGNFGHLMAITEALLGQLYLVIVIALLVSNFGRKRRDD